VHQQSICFENNSLETTCGGGVAASAIEWNATLIHTQWVQHQQCLCRAALPSEDACDGDLI